MIRSLILGVISIFVGSIASAGPIFLTGHDPDFHAQLEVGARNLLTSGIAFVTGGTYVQGTTFAGASTQGSQFLWVESRIPTPGGHLIGKNGLSAIGLSEGTDFTHVNAAEFLALTEAQLGSYSAIAVASSFGGLLTRAELDALTSRSGDIANFINNGGGLFASSECYPCGSNLLAGATAPSLFGFLPISVTSILNVAPYAVTAEGASGPYLLQNGDLQSPTHNAFGETGGLTVLDRDANGNATTLAGNFNITGGGFVPVPEPGTLLLSILGITGLLISRRRTVR